MITVSTDYQKVPELLAAYAEEFKQEHHSIKGGNRSQSREETLLSIFQDQHNELHRGAKLIFKGGMIGAVTGFFYNLQFGGKKTDFFHTRDVLGKISLTRRLSPFVAFGAMYGLAWWAIHDYMVCGHEQTVSLPRYITAHALQGGLMVATIYHPSALLYGLIAGAFVGAIRDYSTKTLFPAGFKLYMKDFDEEKRRNLLRDDQEYQLSLRNVISSRKVFHPI